MRKIVAAYFFFTTLIIGCGSDPLIIDGESCDSDEQCESGLCHTRFSNNVPVAGGQCTHECEWLDDDTDTCPDSQVCLRYNRTGEMHCYVECSSQEDCRLDDGWKCQPVGDYSACLPPL